MISDPGVPGSNSTAVNSLLLCHFFSQSEDSKKFQSLSHKRRWPLHMRASEVYKYLPAVPSFEGTIELLVPSYEGTIELLVPSWEGTNENTTLVENNGEVTT